MRQWTATFNYSSELGDLDVTYDLDDLSQLTILIEQGPPQASISNFTVTRNVEATAIETAGRRSTTKLEKTIDDA